LYGNRRFSTLFKSPPLVPILSQMNPVHIFYPISRRSCQILFQIYTYVFRVVLPFRFSNQNTVCISHFFHAC